MAARSCLKRASIRTHYEAQAELRERMRMDGVGVTGGVAETRAHYDYYTSSNLPGSTLLYAALEWASGGDPVWWRIAFLLGDLLIALGACLLMVRAGAELRSTGARLGFFAVLVAYPTLLRSGTWVPEEKQFQTGLLLLLAAWLLPGPRPSQRQGPAAGGAGALWALSILFKAFGVILLPLVVRHFAGRPVRELVWVLVGVSIVTGVVIRGPQRLVLTLIAQRASRAPVSGRVQHCPGPCAWADASCVVEAHYHLSHALSAWLAWGDHWSSPAGSDWALFWSPGT